MSALHRVLSALNEAPATRDELADVARVPIASLGTYLTDLSRAGLVERAGYVKREVLVVRKVPLWKRSQP